MSKHFNEIKHGQKLAVENTEFMWGWGSPAGQKRAQRRADLIVKSSQIDSSSRVLEIGCGTGNFTKRFSISGAKIYAVDISPELIAKARQRNLPEQQVIFKEVGFEECNVIGPFTVVIGSSILHHLELSESLAKIYDLLEDGGRLCFAEPNILNPQVFCERRFRRFFSYVSPDETAFDRFSLESNLKKLGFTEIKITPFGWLHPSTPQHLIRTVSAISRAFEKTPIIREFAGSLLITARKPIGATNEYAK